MTTKTIETIYSRKNNPLAIMAEKKLSALGLVVSGAFLHPEADSALTGKLLRPDIKNLRETSSSLVKTKL